MLKVIVLTKMGNIHTYEGAKGLKNLGMDNRGIDLDKEIGPLQNWGN